MSIGNNIYKLRTAKNLSQGDLADLLDVSRQSVSKWETDAAIPDLDKLIKLCDAFDVSLDEITGRKTNEQTTIEPQKTETKASSTQKILGYILFAFSLVLILIAIIFGHSVGDYLILFITSVSTMVCGLLCLFAGKKAFYWCIWTIVSPLAVLTPRFVGITFLSVVSGTMLIVFITMFFVARIVFKDTVVKTSKKTTLLLFLAWITPFAVYGFLVFLHTMQVEMQLPNYVYGTIFDIFLNLVCYILVALLETYTVCYIKSLRKRKAKTLSSP